MLAYAVFSIVFFGLALFWPAGTFDYWQAWVFIAVFVVGAMVPTIYVAVEVSRCAADGACASGPFAETRTVQKLINVGIIAGGRRHSEWSARSTTGSAGRRCRQRLSWSATCWWSLGLGHGELVVIQNNYAAATITVEAEQQVVSTGLYGLVRHPMYFGALIMMVGMPLALASYWALLTIIPGAAGPRRPNRRRGEDAASGTRRLRRVHGKVHYRLVPYVW